MPLLTDMENTTNFVFGMISLLLGISIAALPLVPDHMFYLPCCGADLGQQSAGGLLLPPNSRCSQGTPSGFRAALCEKQTSCQVGPSTECPGGKDHPAAPYCFCQYRTIVPCDQSTGNPPPGAIKIPNPVSGLLQCVACGNGYGPNAAGNDCIPATCPSGQKSFCGVCRTPFEEETNAVSSVQIAFGLYVSICASVTILIWIVAFCSF